jgi:histone chaperone ASF1
VTVVILSCHYRDKEFVRIGYYVSNEYDDPELRDNPPEVLNLDRVVRSVLHDKPRVTKVRYYNSPSLNPGPNPGPSSNTNSNLMPIPIYPYFSTISRGTTTS